MWRGVYAVGRPYLSRNGLWMAAVLSCGSEAALSHESAAALWGIRAHENGAIQVSVPFRVRRVHAGIIIHRRLALSEKDVTRHRGIPVTTPICTLIDLAARLPAGQIERAINEADRLDLTDPERLRSVLDQVRRRPGARLLRRTLDRRTFALTDSELERRFLPLAHKAGLPPPQTGQMVNGFKVDFYWPELGLVVETDGLRYHRTPAQQARDRLRDQAHVAAGFTCLRFTRAQVTFDPSHVKTTLSEVVRRLRARPVARTARLAP
jgi:very-short-patch-repair endonuclease